MLGTAERGVALHQSKGVPPGLVKRPHVREVVAPELRQPALLRAEEPARTAAAEVLLGYIEAVRRAREHLKSLKGLFGGGLSLASAVQSTGVAAFIGRGVGGAQGVSIPAMVLLVTAVIVFLTELTSNTATTATFLPILGAVAIGLGVSPLLLIVPMTIAASCAFMMPVATPPNAIVFGSGEVTIPQMCKAGLWLNLVGIALVVLLAYLVAVPVLGIEQL